MRPLESGRTIYYRYMPPARDRKLFKECLRAPLRASRGDRNNIPYTTSIATLKTAKSSFILAVAIFISSTIFFLLVLMVKLYIKLY